MADNVRIPDAVWERHEIEIRKFFPPHRAKAVKLKNLMEHMEKRGLKARPHQWKARLDKWDLTKKRGLNRKASVLDSNNSLVTVPKIPSNHSEQTSSATIYGARMERETNFTSIQWSHRFLTADFENQLDNNLSNPAQALFDHMKLPRLGMSRLCVGTQTMTKALFLLQHLNNLMPDADRNHFKEYVRHLDILRQNASVSIKRDSPAFLRIAAFFLHINSMSTNLGSGILPILIGCLHDVCRDRFGYEHEVTTIIRSLSLSATSGENSVRDVSPRIWKLLRMVQVATLMCWLKGIDKQRPPGHRRLRVLHCFADLLTICGTPELQRSWHILIGKETASEALIELEKHFLEREPGSNAIRSILQSNSITIKRPSIQANDGLLTTTVQLGILKHSKAELNKHVSQRFSFAIDESTDKTVSGQIYDENQNCLLVEVRLSDDAMVPADYLVKEFHVGLTAIVHPNSIFHKMVGPTKMSTRTFASEFSTCTRLWFSLAECVGACKYALSKQCEDCKQVKCYQIVGGRIHDGEKHVGFGCRDICMHNLHDLWAILFDFMGGSESKTVPSVPRWLDVFLEIAIPRFGNDFSRLNHTILRSGSPSSHKAQVRFILGKQNSALYIYRNGATLRRSAIAGANMKMW